MTPVCHKKPIINCSAPLSPVSLGFKPNPQVLTLGLELDLESALTNILFRQLIQTCIKHVQNEVSTGSKDDTNRSLKLWNPNLYYMY